MYPMRLPLMQLHLHAHWHSPGGILTAPRGRES